MSPTPFTSRAPRAEDFILARAMAGEEHPRFVEVLASAGDPTRCAALLEHGWTGTSLTAQEVRETGAAVVRPDGDLHALLLGTDPGGLPALDVLGPTGLRPWVLLVPVAADGARDDLGALHDAGYEVVLEDGANQYLVHADHASTIQSAFDLLETVHRTDAPDPAEDPTADDERAADLSRELSELEARHAEALRQLVQWRARAVDSWSSAATAHAGPAQESLRRELEAIRGTVSWRVTRPLRAVRGAAARLKARA